MSILFLIFSATKIYPPVRISVEACGRKGRKTRNFDLAAPDLYPAASQIAAKKSRGIDYWLEVYCAKRKSYVPVHCITGDIGNAAELEKTATQPVHYVVAFGQSGSARDVTAKYGIFFTFNLPITFLWNFFGKYVSE